MAQQIINTGETANDGTGESLRNAFDAVNNNFANVWAQGPVDSQVVITNNIISTNVSNLPLILSSNGIANIAVASSVLPSVDSIYDLGDTSYQFDTVWARYYRGNAALMSGVPNLSAIATDLLPSANVTFDIGNSTLQWDAIYAQDGNFSRNLTVSGNLIVVGNTIQIGNIVTDTKTIQLSNTAATTTAANGSGVTVGADDNIATMLYNSTGNVWTTNIGISSTGNVTAPYFIGNGSQLTGITSYANANAVAYGESGWAGNIIPATSNAYSLGNATNQWNDLYVSNATIYMNNVPISLSAGNVLTVDGADVVTTNANGQSSIGNLDIDGTQILIAPGSAETLINISPDVEGTAFLQIPNDATANVQNVRLHNGAGNIELGTGSGTNLWYFGNTGVLGTPGNIDMGGSINFNGGGIVQTPDEDFAIRVQDADDDGFSIFQQVDDGAGTVLGQTRLQRDRFLIEFTNSPSPQFRFIETGQIEIPGNIRTTEFVDTSLYVVTDNNSSGSVELKAISYNNDTLGSNVRVTQSNATISTNNAQYTWNFDNTGNLTLPLNGNIVGATANNNGYINWFGNSSGDGGGYTTMNIVPDDTRVGGDQYLILDPTAPGHIHIRAGGTQDNSSADLFLGGENSYFKVGAGSNPDVYAAAGNNVWTFDSTGVVRTSGEFILRAISDTVNLQTLDTGSGNIYSVYLGTNGGLYLAGTEYLNGWLNITHDSGNADINAPAGNINIKPAYGVGNGAAKSINLRGGDADQSDFYTGTGGAVNIIGGLGSSNDGGGGGPGGNINITSGTSSDPAGHAGNINITAGGNVWAFDYTGALAFPSGAGFVKGDSGQIKTNDGTTSALDFRDNAGRGFYTNNSGYTLRSNGSYSWIFNTDGTATVPTSSYGYAQFYTNSTANLYLGSSTYPINVVGSDGTIITPGAVSATGNVSGNYILGNGAFLTGVATSYGDANVSTFLAAYGSNTISTTGNITAGNFVGNISITGNVTGTSPNVELVAGSFTTTFDNTGTATFPGAMQLAVYANSTVRDSAITSPQPGMMIYVTGTGMQVRGATAWNTIAGSGT